MKRRSFIQRTLLLPIPGGLGLSTTSMARAQANWPERPITMVVPYPAGGNTDFVARMTAD